MYVNKEFVIKYVTIGKTGLLNENVPANQSRLKYKKIYYWQLHLQKQNI